MTETTRNEVRLARTYAAPRDVVFKAWTEPDQIAKWWGPEGFDAPREKIEVDLRVGGTFTVVMVLRSEEIARGMGVEAGTEFPDSSEIVELEENALIVLRSAPQPHHGIPDEVLTRISFYDDEGGTRVEIVSGPHTDEMAPNAEMGWQQQLGKLERLLAAA
jgi:uncharacterized protein YndB with AHSA1/START domain